jgi:polar amino acid transport system substrate-binding protein
MKHHRAALFAMVLGAYVLAAQAQISSPPMQTLLVQADRWCPFNCQPGSAAPGYVVELLQHLFEHDGVKVVYQIVPWDRAVRNAVAGKATAVIGATRAEAHARGFLIGNEPIGISKDCLYVAQSNPLVYREAVDLNGLHKVAIVSGYSYAGGLGEWSTDPKNKSRIEIARGDSPVETSLQNLARGRLDGVIDNESVLRMVSQNLGVTDKVRMAGCTGNDEVFVAFSAVLPGASALVLQWDAGLAELRRNAKLMPFLSKYGQKDWK